MEREHPMKPGLLLVEDDPTSAAFLAAALEPLGVPVRIAASAAEAHDAASRGTDRLWLLDAHLPDGSGASLLRGLRDGRPDVPAIAHTASPDPALHMELRRAGFADVVVKPLGVREWRAAVRRHLPSAIADPSPPYEADHLAAWCAPASVAALGGEPTRVATLRKRFLAALPQEACRLSDAFRAGDATALDAELHRLAASCAFVGATHLAACIDRFRVARDCPHAYDRVMRAIRSVVDAGAGT